MVCTTRTCRKTPKIATYLGIAFGYDLVQTMPYRAQHIESGVTLKPMYSWSLFYGHIEKAMSLVYPATSAVHRGAVRSASLVIGGQPTGGHQASMSTK